MNIQKFKFELLTAAIFLALFAWVWRIEAPGGRLSAAETDQYLQAIGNQIKGLEPAERDDFFARVRDFAANDDGQPVYMLNLMRYFDKVRAGPGIAPDFEGSPAQSNAYYEDHVLPIAIKSGAAPLFAGNVSERNVGGGEAGEDRWSRIIVMRYPSRRAFLTLLSDPRYAEFASYKLSALHLGLVPVRGEMSVPDLRLAVGGALLIVFLSLAWLRALRRNPGKE
jgi:uncharacterized protein (DUF1330 family)